MGLFAAMHKMKLRREDLRGKTTMAETLIGVS
jgi:hypothetical protein